MISIPYNDIEIINKILSDNIKSGKVYAFGSRYKWTNRDFSDLDLAIDINRKMSINEIENLKYDFEESNLSYRVDVIDYNNISKEFKRIIDSGNEIIYNKNGAIMGNNENWQEVRLGDIGEIITGNTPPTKNTEYFGNDYNFVTPSDYKNLNKYIFHTERGISKLGENKFKNKMLPPNSIMVTCIGSDMGRILINKNTVLTNQQINSIIVNPDKYFYDFIYYMLLNNASVIKASVSGTAVPILNKSDFSNLEFKIPNLEEQKKIASILSSLDDKIELNNRMNKILEETAQTIFKEWFVNFNFPNEKGKPYKDSGGKMIESELGEIPEGWEIETLNNIVKVTKGKKTKETSSKKTNVLNTQYLTIDCYNNSNIEYTEYTEKMHINKFDIVMVMDGASSGKLFYGKNGILSSTMSKFEIEDSNLNEIVFFFLKNLENEIMYHTTGSAIPHANKQFILNKKIVLPPQNMFHIINNLKEIRYKIIINNEENQKLAAIRDSILPKLMSGEIRIK